MKVDFDIIMTLIKKNDHFIINEHDFEISEYSLFLSEISKIEIFIKKSNFFSNIEQKLFLNDKKNNYSPIQESLHQQFIMNLKRLNLEHNKNINKVLNNHQKNIEKVNHNSSENYSSLIDNIENKIKKKKKSKTGNFKTISTKNRKC
ncbi:MAG: hypothetical protein Q8885_01045 [Candidatus Phytoplasma stylosanthis]|nr:hypothetical protein [Candidatus Phytoplasma stylosanthis]